MNEDEFSDPAGLAFVPAPDMAELLDTTADYVLERFSLSQFKCEKDWAEAVAAWHDASVQLAEESVVSGTLRRVIMGLISMMNGDLRIGVIGLAFCIGANRLLKWNTLSAAAEFLGCTRAALSKAQIAWEDRLSLKRSVHTKSEQNRKTFSEVQKTRHWRRMNRNNPVSFPIPDPTPGWEL